jgi:hypothetical protein
VHQLLGRHGARHGLVGFAVVVRQVQAQAAQRGGGHGFERRRGQAALPGVHQAYALAQASAVHIHIVQEVGQAFFQRPQFVGQHAGCKTAQQVLQRGQRHQLIGREPQAGQLLAPVTGYQPVATQRTVIFHRYVQAFAQVGHVALQGGNGDAQHGHQLVAADGVAAGQQAFVAIEAVNVFHGVASVRGLRIRF